MIPPPATATLRVHPDRTLPMRHRLPACALAALLLAGCAGSEPVDFRKGRDD